jgi:sulfide:quinone oxidoreductase
MASATSHHQVLILGGGTAGLSVAARLLRSDVTDVGVIEPAETHYYQPLWTLAGGGCAPVQESARAQAGVMPRQAGWVKDRAEQIDPGSQTVSTASGAVVGYDYLVVCPGIQLDWARCPGWPRRWPPPWCRATTPMTWPRKPGR